MLEYSDFYDIAEYGNEAWKGSFTKKEIACNAYNYFADFEWSKENGEIAHSIMELCKLLADDVREMGDNVGSEVLAWLYQITDELELFDMDTMDYEDTDEALIEYWKAKQSKTQI